MPDNATSSRFEYVDETIIFRGLCLQSFAIITSMAWVTLQRLL